MKKLLTMIQLKKQLNFEDKIQIQINTLQGDKYNDQCLEILFKGEYITIIEDVQVEEYKINNNLKREAKTLLKYLKEKTYIIDDNIIESVSY